MKFLNRIANLVYFSIDLVISADFVECKAIAAPDCQHQFIEIVVCRGFLRRALARLGATTME
jgi:hypothetical protein